MPSFGEMSMAICHVPWGDTSLPDLSTGRGVCFLPKNPCWLEI